MLIRILGAAILCATSCPAAAQAVGGFGSSADIGDVSAPGGAEFDGETYRVTSGRGETLEPAQDVLHFVWTQHSGDMHLEADIALEEMSAQLNATAGLMIRQDITSTSPYAGVMVNGDGIVSLNYRDAQGQSARRVISDEPHRGAIRIEREGDFVYFSVEGAGGELQHAGGSIRIPLQAPYLVGLAVSGSANQTASFSGVNLEVPQLAYVPDTGYAAQVEATLEIMDVHGAGTRRIVRHFDDKIEAPNWSQDGSTLYYNANGRIWSLALDNGEPVQIDTGRHVDNNNDHGLSPGGSQMVISDQIEADNLSRIHIVTLDGSEPVREVVSDPEARSYWHGWSPDGETLAYVRVGLNDDSYDIWAADVETREISPLIVGPGVDDGPEYSPDGEYLYFNSTRSGAMALWRANSDGSDPAQLTHDPARRDWFPHISPDGRWIAYISFGEDIALGDHPPNREDVQLRLIPVDGSAPPRVLARIFGGQGTINVPSWSPDSQQIAFVSYRLTR